MCCCLMLIDYASNTKRAEMFPIRQFPKLVLSWTVPEDTVPTNV